MGFIINYNKYKNIQSHPFHLVEPSPWPLAASFALLTSTLSGVIVGILIITSLTIQTDLLDSFSTSILLTCTVSIKIYANPDLDKKKFFLIIRIKMEYTNLSIY